MQYQSNGAPTFAIGNANRGKANYKRVREVYLILASKHPGELISAQDIADEMPNVPTRTHLAEKWLTTRTIRKHMKRIPVLQAKVQALRSALGGE